MRVKLLFMFSLMVEIAFPLYAQLEQNFSSVNPALFLYLDDDVYIRQPEKYNNGKHLIVPTPTVYPWEVSVGNGMPNVIRDNAGNLSVYMSCFLVPSPVPFSKVGSFVYTNNSTSLTQWNRPEAGLYWYNPDGTTVDDKISPSFQTGFLPTNIVAVDIESLGIYDDMDSGVEKPIKLVYLPQREKHNRLIAGYEMERLFTDKGILSGFYQMKTDRLQTQKEFILDFINGDTHMNYLKQDGKYYVVSRLNGKRSSLLPGETLPFPSPDPRLRYRRETVTELGTTLESGNYGLDIALDMSDNLWEPYSMQPFRMPGFESDVWWGLVTTFGTGAIEAVANLQRTELALSNDGMNWHYVKPGTPFLDNGTDPQSDDYGCINMGKPVFAGNFSQNPMDLLYFYAASNRRHVGGRKTGISLAIGKNGKWAGLKAEDTPRTFYSMTSTDGTGITKQELMRFSMYDALGVNAVYAPRILADVTQDPREKSILQLDSYVAVAMYSYDETKSHGQGMLLCGTMGSSVRGTEVVSDNYESVGVIDGVNLHNKDLLFKYLKACSDKEPTRIISIKEDMTEIPVVLEASVKNATFYGMQFERGDYGTDNVLNAHYANIAKGPRYWSYVPSVPASPCHTEDFSDEKWTPNRFIPVNAEKGTIAVRMVPQAATTGEEQVVVKMHGDENNNLGIYYTSEGAFVYKVMIHGTEYSSIKIFPPAGKSFNGHQVVLTVEALKARERRFGKIPAEDVTVLRIACPDLGVDETAQQDILWTWKHEQGAVTPADTANARAFAYVAFSAFVAGMKKITVGGGDDSCRNRFVGSIERVEVAERLPAEGGEFWQPRVSALPAEERTLNEYHKSGYDDF